MYIICVSSTTSSSSHRGGGGGGGPVYKLAMVRSGYYLYTALCCLLTLCSPTNIQAAPHMDLMKMQLSPHRTRHTREAECKVNCSNAKHRPVCATDGNTYSHKCEVKRLRRCEGRRIDVQSTGRCKDLEVEITGVTSSKCLEERQQAMEQSSAPSSGVYIPECKSDGTYADVQCHAVTGYCWCVTNHGKPIPGSSVRGDKKINCRGTKGKGIGRRIGKSGRDKSGCSPTDRSTFNTNLIQLFSQEFSRIPKPTPPNYPGAPKGLPIKSGSDSILDTPEKRVIEWKFSELDSDKDNKLKRKEIRSLRRMVKKLVKPKACAKNFDKYCDLDQDSQIARSEWSVCLGVDINNEHSTTPATTDSQSRGDNVRKPGLWDRQLPLNPGSSSDQEHQDHSQRWFPSAPARRNCDEERLVAEEMDRTDPEGRIFIPECVGEGKYRKEQCHKSTGYCWCVNEKSGKPTPGTSTHNVMPDCSKQKSKEFKGCPYPQKKRFLTELLDQMTTQMVEMASNTSETSHMPEPNPDHSLEERVVRWKLYMLDKNQNTVLERKELKQFKKQIKKKKSLRKCGRNFIKYCDEDSNKRISVEEWIDCMGITEQKSNLPMKHLQGPNPLHKYLRN